MEELNHRCQTVGSGNRFMWALAAVPAVWLFLFGLFLLRARAVLGRWPEPYHPDPRDLGFVFHHAVLIAGMPLMFAATVSVVVMTVLTRDRSTRSWWIPIAALGGLMVTIALARVDPGFVFTWLGD